MIDIVISTYNRAEHLKKAIESAINQKNQNFNLFVLDNASTDNTEEVVYSFNSQKIKYIKNSKNLGMIGNWNKALKIGNSNYVNIFHDDDILEPHYVELMVSFIKKNKDTALIHTAANIIDENGNFKKKQVMPYKEVTDGKDFFCSYIQNSLSIICPSVLINRSKLPLDFVFSEKFPYTSDMNFWVRASKYGSVGYISEPIISYRVHINSGSSSIFKNIDVKIQDRLNYGNFLDHEALERGVFFEGIGDNYIKASLSSDIFFTRILGGTVLDILRVAYRCLNQYPQLISFPWFYFYFIKALLPITFLKSLFNKLNGNFNK